MSQLKLASEIIKRSLAEVWEVAKDEWSLHTVYEAAEPDTCMCGHFPIIECCILHNPLTDTYAKVGNCCVKKFIGLPSDLIFQAVKRVRKDCTKSLNMDALSYIQGKGWINNWEFSFYLNTMSKRVLTPKQKEKKVQINKMLLAKIQQVPSSQISQKCVDSTHSH